MKALIVEQNSISQNESELIPISEIFYSIEGEGINAGKPSIFIRVAGCNFAIDGSACRYCDTPYAQYPSQATCHMSALEVLESTSKFPARKVVITGGEPLTYKPQLEAILELLYSHYYTVEIETNGSLPIFELGNGSSWSLDIKTPASGNSTRNNYSNLAKLKEIDQIKFIIADKKDMSFAQQVLSKHYTHEAQVVFQPAWNNCDLNWLVEAIKSNYPFARLSLQLHKIIWGEEKGK